MSEPSKKDRKPRPWLIAAWPGMGNVAVIAAGYLIRQLNMTEHGDLSPGSHFDVMEVDVKGGLLEPARLPRSVFFTWKNPRAGRDLVVFVGSEQPSHGSFAYAQALLDAAAKFNVERIVTFASLACGLHPAEHPKVTCAATDAATLSELRKAEVEPIADGQIGGLNGLILGVAADRGLSGMCLLAEIPYFAMRIPNPKAARAALSVFCVLSGIDVSLEGLDEQAAIVDRALIQAMKKLESPPSESGEATPDEPDDADGDGDGDAEPPEASPQQPPQPSRAGPDLSPAEHQKIESLFDAAAKDPTQAVALKNELDRLGVFKHYEGRFLDLFRKAG